jgi:phosphoadenosine phosphosulfate reductase
MKAITQPLEYYLSRASAGLRAKMANSIELLRKSSSLALQYAPGGFYLAFSGGKDSQALIHIAEMAGVPFEAEMSMTSVDHPEVIRFIRRHYPEVKLVPPENVHV